MPARNHFPGAGITALGLAASRTVESDRPDRLIDDPLAAHLYAAAGVALPMRLEWPAPGQPVTETEALHLHGSRYVGLRTRYYDDLVESAPGQGIDQCVLLGAGLDTRAYRLALPPNFRVFELDQRALMDWKETALAAVPDAPLAERLPLGVDLRGDWPAALCRRGFDPARAAVFIAEGLFAYLRAPDELRLLGDVNRLACAGSVLALDRLAGDPRAGGRIERLSRRSGIDMAALVEDRGDLGAAGFLSAHGWATDERPVSAVARIYGRDLANPFAWRTDDADDEPPWLDTVFVTATR